MDIKELKHIAELKVKPRKLLESTYVASVACALLTVSGNVYVGVCIDTSSSVGFCAEHAAIAQMITNEESRILKIVAVTEGGRILPPCGRCREFIYQVNRENLETEVLVEENKVIKLKELLPYRG